MAKTKVYQELASRCLARDHCVQTGNREWELKHDAIIDAIMAASPSGSGIDGGTQLLSATDTKIRLQCAYHHLNNAGYYDCWTEHHIVVTPTLIGGIRITVTGQDRNGIKEYLADTYYQWLHSSVPAEREDAS